MEDLGISIPRTLASWAYACRCLKVDRAQLKQDGENTFVAAQLLKTLETGELNEDTADAVLPDGVSFGALTVLHHNYF